MADGRHWQHCQAPNVGFRVQVARGKVSCQWQEPGVGLSRTCYMLVAVNWVNSRQLGRQDGVPPTLISMVALCLGLARRPGTIHISLQNITLFSSCVALRCAAAPTSDSAGNCDRNKHLQQPTMAAAASDSASYQTAQNQFVTVGGTAFAYRLLGAAQGIPLVMLMHFRFACPCQPPPHAMQCDEKQCCVLTNVIIRS